MISIKNILPVTTVKRNLMKLLSKVQSDGDPLVITKDGKAAGVLISADDYEGLMETIEITSDQQLMKKLTQAENDFKEGRVYSHEEVFKE